MPDDVEVELPAHDLIPVNVRYEDSLPFGQI